MKNSFFSFVFCFSFLLLGANTSNAAECKLVRAAQNFSLSSCENLHVLVLHGNGVERAQAMGSLIGKDLHSDIMHYFSEKALEGLADKNALVRFFGEKIYNLWTRFLSLSIPKDLSAEIDALASSAGMSSIELKRALVLPDSLAFTNKLKTFPGLHHIHEYGCTSVAKRVTDNNFVYGRNLDFGGVGIWDKYPLLTVVLPEAGSSELKHIVFGADGLLFGGITGVNEAGISFAVHQNYSKDSSFGGIPMIFVGELVLRNAHSIDEAVALLQKYRPNSLWTFVVSDLNRGNTISVESSKQSFEVRQMEGNYLAQTNHINSINLRPFETISLSTKLNSIHRMKVAQDMLFDIGQTSNNLVEQIAGILSYTENTSGDLSAYHDILKAHTIQAVILEKQKNGALVAHMGFESAPVSSGRYLAFPLAGFWNFVDDARFPYQIEDLTHTAAAKRTKEENSSKAFALMFDHKDYEGGLKLLADQNSLDAVLFKSVALYKLHRFDEALKLTQLADDKRFISEASYIQQSLLFMKLLLNVELGKTKEAKNVAKNIVSMLPLNERFQTVAETILADGTLSEKEKNIGFSFFSGDIVVYTE